VRGGNHGVEVRRIAGLVLMVAGGLVVLASLPLWFWLAALGAASVAAGWYIMGAGK